MDSEHVDRCRNCGYDFSLTPPADPLELPLRGAPEAFEELGDLSFLDPVAAPGGSPFRESAARSPARGGSRADGFGDPESCRCSATHSPDDLPLITKPSPPRPPLAVRRATPEVPRLRSLPPRAPTLDLGLDSSSAERAPIETSVDRVAVAELERAEDAGVGARFVAVMVDALILATIDAVVVYFTMQICGIGIGDFAILPRLP